MALSFFHRPRNYFTLVVKYTRDTADREINEQMQKGMEEASIIDGEHTSVVIIKGSHFEEEVQLEHLMPEGERNNLYLCTAGIFMLYEKYFTLNQLKFTDPNPKAVKQIHLGVDIGEELKTKN